MEVSGQLHILAALTSRNKSGTHQIGSWVSLTASLDVLEKRKSLLLPGFKPLTQLIESCHTDYTIPPHMSPENCH
jgi:hypothetical protein